MDKNEITEYLKTIEFGLTDKEKTTQKYKDYTYNVIYDKGIKKLSLNGSNRVYLNGLKDNILKAFINPNNIDFYRTLDYSKKCNIRMLKTYINGLTLDLNGEYIEQISLNNNMNRVFNIKFYLQHYKKINDIMKAVLIKIVGMRF